jgi:hypothetical protein
MGCSNSSHSREKPSIPNLETPMSLAIRNHTPKRFNAEQAHCLFKQHYHESHIKPQDNLVSSKTQFDIQKSSCINIIGYPLETQICSSLDLGLKGDVSSKVYKKDRSNVDEK